MAPETALFSCNSDRPYEGQAACNDDALPAAVGTVLSEASSGIVIAGVTP